MALSQAHLWRWRKDRFGIELSGGNHSVWSPCFSLPCMAFYDLKKQKEMGLAHDRNFSHSETLNGA